MSQAKYENVLFFVTIANIVLGITSVVLGTLALSVISKLNRLEQKLLADKKPGKDLVKWEHRSKVTEVFPRIKPSMLAENRRRFSDDLWS